MTTVNSDIVNKTLKNAAKNLGTNNSTVDNSSIDTSTITEQVTIQAEKILTDYLNDAELAKSLMDYTGLNESTSKTEIQSAAKKAINKCCDQMIDKALSNADIAGTLTDEQKNTAIAIIRGYKITFEQNESFLKSLEDEMSIELEGMVNYQVDQILTDREINNILRPLDKQLYDIKQIANSVFYKTLEFDLSKEINEKIEDILIDPTRSINSKLVKLGLGGVTDVINKHISEYSKHISDSIVGELDKNENVKKQREQIEAIQKQYKEVIEKITEYRKILFEKVEALKKKAMERLKELQDVAIAEISKQIKLNIKW